MVGGPFDSGALLEVLQRPQEKPTKNPRDNGKWCLKMLNDAQPKALVKV